jgi:hypothetical protein
MFIKLCLKDNSFQVFRTDDIMSIDPSWHHEDLFDCYYVRLASQKHPIELSQGQGNRLINILDYQTILPD